MALLAPVSDMIVIVSHMGLTQDQDIITGYDDYYPFQKCTALPGLRSDRNPSCTAAAGCCRNPATGAAWIIENVLPPRNASEDDDACRLKAGESLLSDGSCPPTDSVDITKLNPNRRVHVFIPPVQNVHLIMGGHIHVVLDPTAVITELVVKQQDALRTDSANGAASGCPSSALGYYTGSGRRPHDQRLLQRWPLARQELPPQPRRQRRLRRGPEHRHLERAAEGGADPTQRRLREVSRSVGFGRTHAARRRLPVAGRRTAGDRSPIRAAAGRGRRDRRPQLFPLPIDAAWCLNPRPVRASLNPSFQQFHRGD